MRERILTKVQWGLDVCLLSLPVALTFSRALVEILLVLVVVQWILVHWIGRESLLAKCPITLPVILFLAIGALSMIHSKFLYKSLEELLNLAEYSLLALIAFERFRDSRRLNQLVQVILYSAFAVGIDGIVQLFLGHDLIRMRPPLEIQGMIRLTASFSHSNNLGAYLAMVIPIGLAVLYKNRKRIYFLILPVLGVVMLLTYSRGAWVGLVFALFAFSMMRDKRGILLIILLIALSFFVLPDPLVERVKEIFNLKNVTTQTRFDLWERAWGLFLENPLMGHGLKSFALLLEKGYVHNCFLQMLVEVGLLGLLSFLWILFNFFRSLFKRDTPMVGVGFGCAILAESVHCISDTSLYSIPIATFFWLMLGAGLAVRNQTSFSDSPADKKTLKRL